MSTQEISLYEDPAGLSYADLVAAWHEADSLGSWFRARLAAAVPKGQLRNFADDVGVSYATVKDYRLVAEKYPAEKSGRPDFSFGVAKALMTLPDRLELVSREEPWTVATARQFVASREATEAAAARAARDYAALEPVTPEEKAVWDAAYLPYAGEDGDWEAGQAAQHEAVRRYREEHAGGTASSSPAPTTPVSVPQAVEKTGTDVIETVAPTVETSPDAPSCDPAVLELSASARADQLEAENATLRADYEKLQQENDRLTAKLAQVRAWHGEASARVDELEKDNLLLRVRVEELEEAVTVPVADPVAAASDPEPEPELPPVPEPVAAPGRPPGFEEMLAMGGPVTGPCSKCKKDRSRPVLVEGQDEGKFACESCYAEAEQKGDPVSRP